jgi:threonine aldolase
MTEQDRKVFKEMLKDAIENHSENVAERLKGEFRAIEIKMDSNKAETNLKLDAIKAETSKTNGKVAEHEKLIRELLNSDSKHLAKCPNTEKIITLEKMEIGRKAISSFTWKQVTLGGIIAGLIISLLQILIK